MAIYKFGEKDFEILEETTFSSERINERYDLQRLLKNCIDVIAPGTKVIAEEFGRWTNSQRRIDLLAIDKDANLVVIELKRTQDGGNMELQAIRYASMISTLTLKDAIDIYADYASTESLAQAEEELLAFLGWEEASEDDFGNDVRIVLASGEFSIELTTSVLWLNEKGLDIRCIRMKPFRSNNEILVNVEQIIPLPEAVRFQVGVRAKRAQQKIEKVSNRDTRRRDVVIEGRRYESVTKRMIAYLVVKAAFDQGAEVESMRELMPGPKWIVLSGKLDASSVVREMTKKKAERGVKFKANKYYLGDEQIFYSGENTYVLSNQWGRGTQGVVEALQNQFGLDVDIGWD